MGIAVVVLMREHGLKQRLPLPRLLGVLVSPKRKEAACQAISTFQGSHSTSFLCSNASAPPCDVFVACLRASYTTTGLETSDKAIQRDFDTIPITMPPLRETRARAAGMEGDPASRRVDGGTAK